MAERVLWIDVTVDWSNLEFMLFWPNLSSDTLHITIRLQADMLGITLGIKEEIIEGAAVVKFQNKV